MKAISHPLISLTEAITGIIGGAELTDDQVSEARVLKEQQNRDMWCDHSGPEYLKKGLELLVAGGTWVPREDVSDEINAIERSWFAKVENWLVASGQTAPVALEEVLKVLEADQARSSREKVLYDLLWGHAATGAYELWGLRRDDFGRDAPGGLRRSQSVDYEQIPRMYFFRPVMHWRGAGYYGKGELTPAYLDDDDVFRSIFSNDADADRRPSYLRVMISREHCDQLARKFTAVDPQSAHFVNATSTVARESDCAKWLAGLFASSGSKNRSKGELYKEACTKFPGIGNPNQQAPSRAFIRCWDEATKDAPAWRRHGPVKR